MLLINTCPICGNDLVDMCYPSYPPKYGKECFNCGWKSDLEQEEIMRMPYWNKKYSKLIEELSDRFIIPCNLCNKYFQKDGACPKEIETCNSKEHWALLIERISKNERD